MFLPQVLDALLEAAAAKVQDFEAQEVANMRWAVAETSRVCPDLPRHPYG